MCAKLSYLQSGFLNGLNWMQVVELAAAKKQGLAELEESLMLQVGIVLLMSALMQTDLALNLSSSSAVG